MTHLLDVNLLIALAWPSHVHHGVAHRWFQRTGKRDWATCPLTQAAFVRISSNPRFIDGAVTPAEAVDFLTAMTSISGHSFWSDHPPLTAAGIVSWQFVTDHQQVTDAYLIGLCRMHQGRLATLDRGVSALVPDPAERAERLAIIPG